MFEVRQREPNCDPGNSRQRKCFVLLRGYLSDSREDLRMEAEELIGIRFSGVAGTRPRQVRKKFRCILANGE